VPPPNLIEEVGIYATSDHGRRTQRVVAAVVFHLASKDPLGQIVFTDPFVVDRMRSGGARFFDGVGRQLKELFGREDVVLGVYAGEVLDECVEVLARAQVDQHGTDHLRSIVLRRTSLSSHGLNGRPNGAPWHGLGEEPQANEVGYPQGGPPSDLRRVTLMSEPEHDEHKRRRGCWLGVLVLLGMLAAGCSSASAPSNSSARASTSTPNTRTTTGSGLLAVPTAPGFKPLLVGLIDKGAEAPYHLGQAYPPVDLTGVASGLVGVVVNATWAQLEPRQGEFDFGVLDASFGAIATYDRAHPESPLGARLRIFAAFAAPAWAKALSGPPIAVPVKAGTTSTPTLGRWWEAPYRAAWAGLQQALASHYDSQPVLRDVAVSSCATLTAEPFVITPGTVKAASAAGWTPAAQQACLDGAFSDYAAWRHTAIYYPMNPFPGDLAITTEVMGRCAHSEVGGGPWCILGNNALSSDSATTQRVAAVYAEINTLWTANPTGTPISFQMNSPTASIQCGALDVAVSHHALSVELWPQGITEETPSTLDTWNANLAAGLQPTC
jgi:hypothetical protein